jgi:hypothetical protein
VTIRGLVFRTTSVVKTLLIVVFIFLPLNRVVWVESVPLTLKPCPSFLHGFSNAFVDLAPFVTKIKKSACSKRKPPFPHLAVNRCVRRLQPFQVVDFHLPASLSERT